MKNSGRYSRQTMLPRFGENGQQKLLSSSALVVGLGGLGSPVSMYLAGAGIGRLGIADADTVSLTNLHRQILYNENQIGRYKTEMARQRIASLSSETVIECYNTAVTRDNVMSMVGKYDVVVDCCDNFSTRYLLDEACFSCGRPLVFGAIGEFAGQTTILDYKRKKRLTDLYPDRDELCARQKSVLGVIGPVPGVIGAIQASEVIKLLVGIDDLLDGKLFVISLLNLHSDIIEF